MPKLVKPSSDPLTWYIAGEGAHVGDSTNSVAKLARKPKQVKLPKGYVDLDFIRAEGVNGKIKAMLHKDWTGFVVETSRPSPQSSKGGLVIFVPAVTLENATKQATSSDKPTVDPSVSAVANHIYKSGDYLGNLHQYIKAPNDTESWMGKAVDTSCGVLILIPHVTMANMKANQAKWKTSSKEAK